MPLYDMEIDETKKPSVIKKIFKAIAISILAAVYIILFIRLFVSCDPGIVDDVIKTDAIIEAHDSDPENFEIRKYEISNWYKSINGGKLLALSNLYHIPATNDLQVTVKFNKDILTVGDMEYSAENLPFSFSLMDENEIFHTDYTAIYEERFSFGYIRLDFSDIALELEGTADENGDPERKEYILYIKMLDENGEYADFESFDLYTKDKINYKKINY